MPKRFLNTDVLTEAKNRISWSFDRFKRLCVSFSGGKDSTVMLHLVMEEAIKRNRRVAVLFIDWEVQFTATIKHVEAMFKEYEQWIEPYWICEPLVTVNGCSQIQPEWTCWDESCKGLWVREKPAQACKRLPFVYPGMTFEEFVTLFTRWYAWDTEAGFFVGIRAQESLNRFRAIARKAQYCLDDKPYTANIVDKSWNIYPIFDWAVDDDWTYFAKTHKPYNSLYDVMYKAGMSVSQMRIDEPFGDTQRISLWLYQVIEPLLWAKMSLRVAGANTGELYSREKGSIMGIHTVKLPPGYTWESFTNHLLETMPPATSTHYKNKFARYLNFYRERGYPDGIPQEAPIELENIGKVGSWRCLAKCLLRNDYWCSTIGFSATKSSAYNKYLDLMRRKRDEWGIYA